MRIFKHHVFHRWAYSEKLSDEALEKAVSEIEMGLYETNLGSGLYKKRIAKKGQGKRGSYRMLVAFKDGEKIFFYMASPKMIVVI
jgi:hypothetical protein